MISATACEKMIKICTVSVHSFSGLRSDMCVFAGLRCSDNIFNLNIKQLIYLTRFIFVYFNFDGSSTVGNHFIRLESDEMVVNDSEHCGKEIIKTGGTVFDLSDWKLVGSVIHCDELSFSRGLNNAYLLNDGSSLQLSAGGLMLFAVSDSPAVVLYSGGYLIHPFSFLAVEFQGIPINSMREERKEYERNMAFTFSFL